MANGTPQLVIDGKVVPSTSVTNPDNTVTLTPETALTDGDHSLSYNLKDAAGNVSEAAPAVTVTVDTIALLTVDKPIAGDDIVNAEEAEKGFNVTGTGTAGDKITLTYGTDTKVEIGPAFVGANGKWTIAVAPEDVTTMGNGLETLTITAKDPAGNVNSETADITIVPATELTITSPIAGDNIVNAEEADTGFNVTGTGTADDTIVLKNEASEIIGTAIVGADNKWSIPVNQDDITAMGEGSEKLTATTASNLTGTSVTITIDTVAPDDNTTEIIVDNITADNVINAIEAEGNIAITGKVSGDYSEGNTVTIKVNGINYTGKVDFSGNFSIDVPGTGLVADADKFIEVSVAATDAAGNIGTVSSTKDYTVDTDAPTAATTTVVVDNLTDDNTINKAESEADVAVTGTVSGEFTVGDVVTVMVDGTGYTGTVDINGKFSIDVPGTALVADTDKIIEVSVSATDQAGNIGSVSSTKDYTVDRIAPDDISTQITINDLTADNVINKAESEADVAVTGTVSGEFTLDDVVTVTVNGIDYTGTVDVNGNFSIDVPGTELVADADAIIEISIVATDKAGNTGTVNATKDYTVNTDEIIAAADNFVDFQLDATPSRTENEKPSDLDKTGFTVVGASLGPVLGAGVVANVVNNSVVLEVGEDQVREVTVKGNAGGIQVVGTMDLSLYKLNESTNEWEIQEVKENWVVSYLLGGVSKDTKFSLDEGQWLFVMSGGEGISALTGYTLEFKKDVVLDYSEATAVSGSVTGDILAGDDSNFSYDELPGGTTVTSITSFNGVQEIETGSNVIQGQYGTLTISSDGTYEYKINEDFRGPYGSEESFTYTITSPDGNTASADLNIQLNILPVDQQIKVDENLVVDIEPTVILDTKDSAIKDAVGFGVLDLSFGSSSVLDLELLGGKPPLEFTVGDNQMRELTLHGSGGGVDIAKTYSMAVYKLDENTGQYVQVHFEKNWFNVPFLGGKSDPLTLQFGEGDYKAVLLTAGGLGLLSGNGLYVDRDTIYDYNIPSKFTGQIEGDATPDAGTVILKVGEESVTSGAPVTYQGKYGQLTIDANGEYTYSVDNNSNNPTWKPPYGEVDSFRLVTKDANGKAAVETLNIKISTHTATNDFNEATVNEQNVTSDIQYNRDYKAVGNHGNTMEETFEIGSNKVASATINVQSSAKNVTYTLTNTTTGEVFTKQVSGDKGQSLNDTIYDLPAGAYKINIVTSGGFAGGNIKGYQFVVDLVHTDEFKGSTFNPVTGLLLDNDTGIDNVSELKVGSKSVFVSDPNQGAKSIDIEGLYGTLTVNKDGSYSYLPNGEAYGIENFTYETISVTGVKETANLEINVGKTITASVYDDSVTSSAADDSFTMGAGADTVIFTNLGDTKGGNGNNGIDNWTDFNATQGDKIDIAGLLDGNQTAGNIGNYLAYESGVLMVDRNGNAEYEAMLQITATDLDELLGSINWQVESAGIANFSIGAIGEDVINISDDTYDSPLINLSEELNTFNLSGAGQSISLSDIFENEIIDISGTGANTLNISDGDIINSGASNPIYVKGNSDDTVDLQGNGWVNTQQTVKDNEGQEYNVWQVDSNSSSQIYIDTEIANII
ncbi:BapA/Bap/LapF family large adhesin [Psychrobacter sp. DAB_AL43B]|uniref:BapA/Bap/LapF family large adhesin n=1 Tax=Psychrobacter sp. DAB_AL43B TaxID=1028416 RepID=UPI0009A62C7F|nr:BapA/Bap/LapF family large adhesin [Psychrobacter sp. DAB_AL43B]SLJ85272.1 hypothetical protein DABAL43B_2084 [Psychrobacter sp. DAB_AL43B]